KRLDSGIMITSSHNPYDYNGFKIKNKYGAGATSEQTKEVEKIIEKPEIPAKGRGIVEKVNYDAEYADAIRGVVDVPLIVKSGMKIVLDVMYGSGAGYFEKILAGYKGLRVIHSKRDPLFGGITPEPIRKNLLGLEEAVRAEKADIGIAIDGDGDRMALVDEKGNYLPTHKALVFLLLHHVKNRKARIKFVKTISGTSLLWKLAKEYGVDMEEVPVGFKHIAERMIKDRGVIGGEESGGVGFGYFVPERDGVLSNLMVLEFLASEGKNAGAVIRQLDKKYGPYMYDRVDLRFNEKDRENIIKSVNGLEKTGLIAGKKIASVSRLDGIKYILSDNEWILFRYSGTEPLLRIYSEAPSMKRVAENLAFGQRVAVRRRKRPHTQGNR
ncbi:MAG TPA: phosphoglucomutase/phosphomannomutase family protein, partial [Candidatus Goldiibacteriota bacterium]|nr:phosphoglucomutase/phosphomannomutase family protein [Candidatus Goldiibacteriota bacterium]